MSTAIENSRYPYPLPTSKPRPLAESPRSERAKETSSETRLASGLISAEAVHDRYFLRDLAKIGLTRDVIDRAPPFDATVLLGEFVESCAFESNT